MNRLVLSDTEELHCRINEMSERIRQLEDALSSLQATVSSERHPLLRDELLAVKYGTNSRRETSEGSSEGALSPTIEALGTLSVGENGETKYIGCSGSAEVPCSRVFKT